MDPYTLSYAINTIAVALAKCLDEEQLEIVAVAFTQLGDTLATISTQKARCSQNAEDSEE